jgi:protein TonB
MLHPFVSSPNANRNVAPVLALSALVHVGLLFLVLTSTRVVHLTHVPEAMTEKLRFADLAFRRSPDPAPRSSARGQRGNRAKAAPAFKLPELLLSFDLALPEPAPLPDYQPEYAALEIGQGVDVADDALHLGVGPVAASPRPAAALYNAYEEVAVEKRAVPAPANPKPRYPSRMVRRGIETNFNVYFVVDTSGIVDRETVELPPAVQQEFTSAVAEALFSWRFVPAELGGRRVRQRVLQPFSFRMEEQFSAVGRR